VFARRSAPGGDEAAPRCAHCARQFPDAHAAAVHEAACAKRARAAPRSPPGASAPARPPQPLLPPRTPDLAAALARGREALAQSAPRARSRSAPRRPHTQSDVGSGAYARAALSATAPRRSLASTEGALPSRAALLSQDGGRLTLAERVSGACARARAPPRLIAAAGR
jgi:hypothetical protein